MSLLASALDGRYNVMTRPGLVGSPPTAVSFLGTAFGLAYFAQGPCLSLSELYNGFRAVG
jgi:hypothetical protein